MTSGTKELIIQLLELYRDLPFLWDKKHKDYKNKDRRTKGLEVLLEIYKELEPNATIKTMTKKIQNLRTNYCKELQKVENSYRTGADEIYVPTLFYFDTLSFLGASSESFQTAKDPLNDTEDITFASSDGEITSEHHCETSIPPQRKKYKIKPEVIFKKQDKPMTGELMSHSNNEEDWTVFGKAIGLQLRDLDKKTLTITQKIISDAIYYAKMGLLTQNSSINLGPPVTHTRKYPYASPSTSSHAPRRQRELSHQYKRSSSHEYDSNE